MCFAQSHFPQKSRFFLPSSFDPHGTGEGGGWGWGWLVSTVLCFSWRARQTPIVSLIALCERLTSNTTMWRCQLPWPENSAREQPTLHNICEQKAWSSLGAKDANIWRALLKMMWRNFGQEFSWWGKCYCVVGKGNKKISKLKVSEFYVEFKIENEKKNSKMFNFRVCFSRKKYKKEVKFDYAILLCCKCLSENNIALILECITIANVKGTKQRRSLTGRCLFAVQFGEEGCQPEEPCWATPALKPGCPLLSPEHRLGIRHKNHKPLNENITEIEMIRDASK